MLLLMILRVVVGASATAVRPHNINSTSACRRLRASLEIRRARPKSRAPTPRGLDRRLMSALGTHTKKRLTGIDESDAKQYAAAAIARLQQEDSAAGDQSPSPSLHHRASSAAQRRKDRTGRRSSLRIAHRQRLQCFFHGCKHTENHP